MCDKWVNLEAPSVFTVYVLVKHGSSTYKHHTKFYQTVRRQTPILKVYRNVNNVSVNKLIAKKYGVKPPSWMGDILR